MLLAVLGVCVVPLAGKKKQAEINLLNQSTVPVAQNIRGEESFVCVASDVNLVTAGLVHLPISHLFSNHEHGTHLVPFLTI